MSWEAVTAICAVLSVIGALSIFVLNLTVKEQLSQFRLEMERSMGKMKEENEHLLKTEIKNINIHLEEVETYVHEKYHHLANYVMRTANGEK